MHESFQPARNQYGSNLVNLTNKAQPTSFKNTMRSKLKYECGEVFAPACQIETAQFRN